MPKVTQLLSGRTRTIYPNSAQPPPPYSRIRPSGLCGFRFPLAFVFIPSVQGCKNGQEGVAPKGLTDHLGRSTHGPDY